MTRFGTNHGRGWRGFFGMVAATCMLAAAPLVQAATCETEVPATCTPVAECAETTDGNFRAALVGTDFDGTNTTFTYRVCGVPPTQALSHWVLGLSPVCQTMIVGATPEGTEVVPDPTTCLSGYKWDTGTGVDDCDVAGCAAGSVFEVTFAGNVGVSVTTVGNTIATKAGQLVETACVEGPTSQCTPNEDPACLDDASCSDGNACNGTETCDPQAGCQPGTPLGCDDGDACNGLETCDPGSGCQPGTSLQCDDGDACNGEETCDPGSGCQPAMPPDCDDGLVCTTDDCDPDLGCTHEGVGGCCDADEDCDDESVCTGAESCDLDSGTCQLGTPLACDDGDVCNGDESCDALGGCQPGTPLTCDDENACNGGETCDTVSGCQPGTPLDCDDGVPCNGEEACLPDSGCAEPGATDCADTDSCTEDLCTETGCVHTPVADCCHDAGDCDDQDACTTDACTGDVCVHTPVTGLPPEDTCADMQDDDCDGPIDCMDTDCAGVTPCPPIKKDPATIKFGPAGLGLDVFKGHGRVEPGTALDVGASEIGWMVSNDRGAVWRGALIPGDFDQNVAGTVFRFKDAGARYGTARRFGIYKAKIRISRDGTSYGFKVMAYGDLSKATDPNMAIQFYIGDRNWSHYEPWTRTSAGWKATGFE